MADHDDDGDEDDDDDDAPLLTDAEARLIAERLREHRSNPGAVRPWADVRADVIAGAYAGGGEWAAELDRRVAEVGQGGTDDTLTLDEYRAHIERRRAERKTAR